MVCDSMGVQVFSSEGVFMTEFGREHFNLPLCLAIAGDNRILVGDGDKRVWVFGFAVE